ncbi:MAG: hypothetical protein LUH40_05465, partial [Clostridiales bacterium]|nr:hypothetical protein [Clostridiales bacterium]
DLVHFLDSLSFARLGYETHYYISGETVHNFDSIFPYYIIATSGMIFYNESATIGIAMKAKEFKNKYRDEFSKKISLCRLVAKILRSPDEVRDFCLPYCTNFHKMQSVSNRLSLYITDETLPLLKYDKSNEQITDYLCTLCDINSHLLLDLNYHDIILYKDAVTDFVRTGVIHGINPNFDIYVAEEDRDSFLLYILDYIEQKNMSFRITSDKMNRLSREIMITVIRSETYKNDVFFTNLPASDDAYDTGYSVLAACNYSIIDDYSNFIEYLKLFSYTENTDTSINYLKSQITFLQKMYSA